jgi:hypothetical protein
MGNNQEVTINSWKEFIAIVDTLDVGTPFRPAYIFRGQGVSSWSLNHTLLRALTLDGRIKPLCCC